MSVRTQRAAPLARAGLAGWTAFLAATAVGLHHLGGALAPPPFTEPSHLSDWLAAREPAEAAVAIVRLVVLAAAWYLLAATVAGTLARLAGIASWVRTADALSVPFVRGLVNAGLGVAFATAALAGAGHAAVADERVGPAPAAAGVTMRMLPDEAAPSATTASAAPTMRRLDDPTSTSTPADTVPPPAPPPTGEPHPDSPGPGTWEIQPGEHFWGVAERVLASAWGRSPTDHEVDPYWRTLVGANTGILRDAGNPDLLFPGQVISVPSPPAAPPS